jgi:hypothetical protein
MTAGNVLGAIGYYFFGPFGYLVGSLIGNALFPPGGNGPMARAWKSASRSPNTVGPCPRSTGPPPFLERSSGRRHG